jgi:hypothetical protein
MKTFLRTKPFYVAIILILLLLLLWIYKEPTKADEFYKSFHIVKRINFPTSKFVDNLSSAMNSNTKFVYHNSKFEKKRLHLLPDFQRHAIENIISMDDSISIPILLNNIHDKNKVEHSSAMLYLIFTSNTDLNKSCKYMEYMIPFLLSNDEKTQEVLCDLIILTKLNLNQKQIAILKNNKMLNAYSIADSPVALTIYEYINGDND